MSETFHWPRNVAVGGNLVAAPGVETVLAKPILIDCVRVDQ